MSFKMSGQLTSYDYFKFPEGIFLAFDGQFRQFFNLPTTKNMKNSTLNRAEEVIIKSTTMNLYPTKLLSFLANHVRISIIEKTEYLQKIIINWIWQPRSLCVCVCVWVCVCVCVCLSLYEIFCKLMFLETS